MSSEAMAYEHYVAVAAAAVSSADALSHGFVQGVTKGMRSKRHRKYIRNNRLNMPLMTLIQ